MCKSSQPGENETRMRNNSARIIERYDSWIRILSGAMDASNKDHMGNMECRTTECKGERKMWSVKKMERMHRWKMDATTTKEANGRKTQTLETREAKAERGRSEEQNAGGKQKIEGAAKGGKELKENMESEWRSECESARDEIKVKRRKMEGRWGNQKARRTEENGDQRRKGRGRISEQNGNGKEDSKTAKY